MTQTTLRMPLALMKLSSAAISYSRPRGVPCSPWAKPSYQPFGTNDCESATTELSGMSLASTFQVARLDSSRRLTQAICSAPRKRDFGP